MKKQSRQRGPYKKLLSVFEIDELANKHADSAVFATNRNGEQVLEPWLKELRFNQAWQVAEMVLGKPIAEHEFQECWSRTLPPRNKNQTPEETPNTATFGGYRLKRRSALNRDQKQKPRPKRK